MGRQKLHAAQAHLAAWAFLRGAVSAYSAVLSQPEWSPSASLNLRRVLAVYSSKLSTPSWLASSLSKPLRRPSSISPNSIFPSLSLSARAKRRASLSASEAAGGPNERRWRGVVEVSGTVIAAA